MRKILGAGLAALVCIGMVPEADAATPAVKISFVYYNSPGKDTGLNSSLNAEYVTIKNTTAYPKSLTGWTLRDAQTHVYKFGTYTLPKYGSVRVHTGKGTNTLTDRYWGQSWYIWNNTGDRATLRTATGVFDYACSWGSTGSYKYC